jgi:hypothetical protein
MTTSHGQATTTTNLQEYPGSFDGYTKINDRVATSHARRRLPASSHHRNDNFAFVIRRRKVAKCVPRVAQPVRPIYNGYQLSRLEALVQVRQMLVLFQYPSRTRAFILLTSRRSTTA